MARLCALMHDAHEAYVSDMASPAKVACRMQSCTHEGTLPFYHSDYDVFEMQHALHIRDAFSLSVGFHQHAADIKRWDLIALATERRDLMPADSDEWEILRGVEAWNKPGSLLRDEVAAIHWTGWKRAFFDRFADLTAQI